MSARIRMALCEHLPPLLICTVVAAAATWPLMLHPARHIPTGKESVATVPLLNLWTVWWNGDRASRLLNEYWDAPIFHPYRGSFALAEAQPTQIAVAPLVLIGAGLPVAYNGYLLANLVLNGCLAHGLVRWVGLSRIAALSVAGMTTSLPFVHWQLGVLQLIPVWGVLWTIWELSRLVQSPQRTGTAVRLGAAFAMTYWLCNYYGLFLSVLLFINGAWLLFPGLKCWNTWRGLLIAASVSGTLVAPVVAAQLRHIAKNEWHRRAWEVAVLSASPADYSAAPGRVLFSMPIRQDELRGPVRTLSPGTLKWVLASAGIVIGLVWRPTRQVDSHACAGRQVRRWTVFWLSLGCTAFALSMGTRLTIAGFSPHSVLVQIWPGFAQIRSVFRFAVFVQLAVVMLAAPAIDRLQQTDANRDSIRIMARRILAGLLGMLAVLEVWPERAELYQIPTPDGNKHWAVWLEANTPPEVIIACIPFAPGGRVEDFLVEAEWMYWQTVHRRRMLNGYSGYFPETYRRIREQSADSFTASNLDLLTESGAQYVVVRNADAPVGQLRAIGSFSDRLRRVHVDTNSGVEIFELRDTRAAPSTTP